MMVPSLGAGLGNDGSVEDGSSSIVEVGIGRRLGAREVIQARTERASWVPLHRALEILAIRGR